MNSPTTGTSVAPPEGYTTSTDGMSSAVRNIQTAAEDAQQEVKDLKPTEVTAADFGNRHTAFHVDYAAAIDQIGAGADAMCANLISFAAQIGAAGASYSANEAGATTTVQSSAQGL